jgi:hypothetical protein
VRRRGCESVTAASATTAAVATAAATTAIATTTATATAAASAATAVATTAATTTTAIFTRTGFVYSQPATIELPFVKPVDCGLSLSVVVHFDETEALAPASRTILDHLRALHGAELREQLFQGRITDTVREIAYVKLLAHR